MGYAKAVEQERQVIRYNNLIMHDRCGIQYHTESGVAAFVTSTMIAGIGYGLSFNLVAEVAVSAVPAERAGAAGSIAETSNELGNALSITLLGSLAALNFRLHGPGVAGTFDETLDKAGIAPDLVMPAREAFLIGLHIAAGMGGVLMLIVGIVALIWLPRKLPG
ncbi:hypothetical protein Q0601_20155 [Paracoccus onubensis]|uniref:hypothetical protein n=1 Tax=Paracoccus onubensis TaxID=1675788 RepID=UPI002731BFDB|nr:hypothetical protein [Paracoccus onubensis]MDP0929504.1 hypothetical protein [Paracoccus onubensis]